MEIKSILRQAYRVWWWQTYTVFLIASFVWLLLALGGVFGFGVALAFVLFNLWRLITKWSNRSLATWTVGSATHAFFMVYATKVWALRTGLDEFGMVFGTLVVFMLLQQMLPIFKPTSSVEKSE